MKPILIQGAMEVEITHLKKVMTNLEEINLYGYVFYKGEIDKIPVVISKTGVGLIEASLATFIGITNFKPKLVINQGTAGSCSEKLHTGDIIIGDTCININSFMANGDSPLEWELLTFKEGKDQFIEYKSNINIKDIFKNYNNVIIGVIGSGDVWDKNIDRLKWFNKKYSVLCEDMETTSVYQVCNKLEVPVIGIRIISDNEISKEQYDKSVALKLQKFIIKVCKEL